MSDPEMVVVDGIRYRPEDAPTPVSSEVSEKAAPRKPANKATSPAADKAKA